MQEAPLEVLDLSVRSDHCLKRSGYKTVGDVVDAISSGLDLKKFDYMMNEIYGDDDKASDEDDSYLLDDEEDEEFDEEDDWDDEDEDDDSWEDSEDDDWDDESDDY